MFHSGHRERSEEPDGKFWTPEQVQSLWDTYPTGTAPSGIILAAEGRRGQGSPVSWQEKGCAGG